MRFESVKEAEYAIYSVSLPLTTTDKPESLMRGEWARDAYYPLLRRYLGRAFLPLMCPDEVAERGQFARFEVAQVGPHFHETMSEEQGKWFLSQKYRQMWILVTDNAHSGLESITTLGCALFTSRRSCACAPFGGQMRVHDESSDVAWVLVLIKCVCATIAVCRCFVMTAIWDCDVVKWLVVNARLEHVRVSFCGAKTSYTVFVLFFPAPRFLKSEFALQSQQRSHSVG